MQTTLAVMAVTLVSSLVAVFVVGKLLGDLNPTDSLSSCIKGPQRLAAYPLLSEESVYLWSQA